MIDSCYSFQHMHTCRPVFEVQIELFTGSIALIPVDIAMETNEIFLSNVSCRKAFLDVMING